MPAPSEIQIRDPFVLFVPEDGCYYLYGTTDKDCWKGPAVGFDAYRGSDLEHWEGPFPVFRPAPGFWADQNFWAPEVHRWRGRYYMFASFKTNDKRRGTQILIADNPLGPFAPHSPGPVTPPDWECLDGTFFIDDEGSPWIVFCHEWVQVRDGEIWARQLSQDLLHTIGEPVLLFKASSAPWISPVRRYFENGEGDGYVTDGPFLYRTSAGTLLMLWSSFSAGQYTQALARSISGKVQGPWVHLPPLYTGDGGHGMLFLTAAGELKLTFHSPNTTPYERPCLLAIQECGDGLRLG